MYNKLLASSSDPQKLSLTIKGILLAVVPFVVALTGLPEADLNGIVDLIVNIVYLGGSLASAMITLWGLLRKVYYGRWSAD